MTEQRRDPVPAIERVGDQLIASWHGQETRSRRRRRVFAGVFATVTLGVSTAFAASQLLVGTPGPHQNELDNGTSAVLRSGATSTSRWDLTAFKRDSRTCFGLRVSTEGRAFYGDDCDAGFPSTTSLTVGTQSLPGQSFIYGATSEDARRVRVTNAGQTFDAPLVQSDKVDVADGLRTFVVPIDGPLDAVPDVAVLSASGQILTEDP